MQHELKWNVCTRNVTQLTTMELTHITQLLDALGPDWPEVDIERADDATWLIDFDEDLGIVVECLEEPARMVLTTPLGSPEVDRRFAVYENLLMFNSLWQETAGVLRAALTGRDGEVTLAIEIGEFPQTASGMKKLLGEWCDVAREWRTYVQAPSYEMRLPPLPFMELATRA